MNFKNSYLKSILTLITGTTIAQAIPVAISPILTRLYTPDDFGLFALFLSITSIISVAVSGRYELAIMLPKEKKDAINLLVLSVIISTVLSLIILLIILIWGRDIAYTLGNKNIYPWLYFVPFSLFLSGIYQSLNYWSSRYQNYHRLAVNRVLQTATTGTTNIFLGFAKNGAFGLIIGHMIGQLIATIRLGISSTRSDKISMSFIETNKMKTLAKRYDQFPKISVWSALLNNASSQLPIFILSAFFSSTIVGWYSLAHRTLKMPMTVLGNAIGQVFFQASSNLRNIDPLKLKQMTYQSYKALLNIGIIPISIVFGFGDIIFSFLFGEAWLPAGEYARLLSIWLLLVFVSSPLSLLFTVMEKEGTLLLFNISIFISRILSLFIGALIFKDAFITVLLFAVSGIIFWFWHCVYILKLVEIPYNKSITYTLFVIMIGLVFSSLLRIMIL
ncbi:oligosaccharide flippase family protein [Bacillus sp. REN3]|uniref:oligosaccharide flippase family protein n=1 Tax=Bacillus sp. REN3 TaxID=2802440 RepID=UPI0032C0D110